MFSFTIFVYIPAGKQYTQVKLRTPHLYVALKIQLFKFGP